MDHVVSRVFLALQIRSHANRPTSDFSKCPHLLWDLFVEQGVPSSAISIILKHKQCTRHDLVMGQDVTGDLDHQSNRTKSMVYAQALDNQSSSSAVAEANLLVGRCIAMKWMRRGRCICSATWPDLIMCTYYNRAEPLRHLRFCKLIDHVGELETS
jgi:hypothetical protein